MRRPVEMRRPAVGKSTDVNRKIRKPVIFPSFFHHFSIIFLLNQPPSHHITLVSGCPIVQLPSPVAVWFSAICPIHFWYKAESRGFFRLWMSLVWRSILKQFESAQVHERKCDFRIYLYIPTSVPLVAFFSPAPRRRSCWISGNGISGTCLCIANTRKTDPTWVLAHRSTITIRSAVQSTFCPHFFLEQVEQNN